MFPDGHLGSVNFSPGCSTVLETVEIQSCDKDKKIAAPFSFFTVRDEELEEALCL
jgi:hypothetical protein